MKRLWLSLLISAALLGPTPSRAQRLIAAPPLSPALGAVPGPATQSGLPALPAAPAALGSLPALSSLPESPLAELAALDKELPPAAPGADPLYQELTQLLEVPEGIAPEELGYLRSVTQRMLESPSGRSLAEQFVKGKTSVQLSLEDFPDTQIAVLNGKKEIANGSLGVAYQFSKPAPRVQLNRAFTQSDESLSVAAEVLAHELLGHVQAGLHASRAGADVWIFGAHWGDELRAYLIGWTVLAELGHNFEERHPVWTYLKDPAEFMKDFSSRWDSYAELLSSRHAEDPKAAYRERIEQAEAAVDELEQKRLRILFLKKAVASFTARGVPQEKFQALAQELQQSLELNAMSRRNRKAAIERLWSSWIWTARESRLRKLRETFQQPVFAWLEQEAEQFSRRLSVLLQGKKPASEAPAAPAAPGQILEAELLKMCRADAAVHPEHWREIFWLEKDASSNYRINGEAAEKLAGPGPAAWVRHPQDPDAVVKLYPKALAPLMDAALEQLGASPQILHRGKAELPDGRQAAYFVQERIEGSDLSEMTPEKFAAVRDLFEQLAARRILPPKAQVLDPLIMVGRSAGNPGERAYILEAAGFKPEGWFSRWIGFFSGSDRVRGAYGRLLEQYSRRLGPAALK